MEDDTIFFSSCFAIGPFPSPSSVLTLTFIRISNSHSKINNKGRGSLLQTKSLLKTKIRCLWNTYENVNKKENTPKL